MMAESVVVAVVYALTCLQKLQGLDLGQVQLIFSNETVFYYASNSAP
jgi:hypothetical protein